MTNEILSPPPLYMQLSEEGLYWALRRENDAFLRRQKWWWIHFLKGTLRSRRQQLQQRLAREAEESVAAMIRARGYQAHLTTYHCPFDLWVEDTQGQAARVEVKVSLYGLCRDTRKGGRFQANIHQHLDADLVVFIARNGKDWPFIIPMPDIGKRHNIAIWSPCPADYRGQWSTYLEAWQHLDQAITNSQPRAWQLTLSPGATGGTR